MLRHPKNGTTVSDVPILLDSGTDVTLIPQVSVALLGMTMGINESCELMGFDGSVNEVTRRFSTGPALGVQEYAL
jgi:hypothetical protein